MPARYDEIGRSYARHRRADPRWADAIRRALGDARSVVNVGAGTGSYEPADRRVVAVEPSAVMIGQRSPDAAPVARARAEALPFPARSFDASLAVLTVHHWADVERGVAELRRVASRHVVVTWDPVATASAGFWLTRDYFPDLDADLTDLPALPEILTELPDAAVTPLSVPHDCTDGFMAAYWRRPEAYLDDAVRASISSFAIRDDHALRSGLDRLAADLESGEWRTRNAALLDRAEVDVGYRLVVAESG